MFSHHRNKMPLPEPYVLFSTHNKESYHNTESFKEDLHFPLMYDISYKVQNSSVLNLDRALSGVWKDIDCRERHVSVQWETKSCEVWESALPADDQRQA